MGGNSRVAKDQSYRRRSAKVGGSHGFAASAAATSGGPESASRHQGCRGAEVNPDAGKPMSEEEKRILFGGAKPG